MGEIKKQTLSGVKWTAIERFSIQGVQFLLGIIIARLLTPADYGLVALLGIFLTISQSIIDCGISNALIRKPDLSEEDYSTSFYFNIGMSALCALALFLGSPWIADFFNQPLLSPIAKVYSLNLIIGAFGMVQGAKLTINLNFKSIARINFIAALGSGVTCLILAFFGWGVWALVLQAIMANVIKNILLWSVTKWYPKLIFSKKSFKNLFDFGSKITASSLLHSLYCEMTGIVIGKFYTPAALGNYSRGITLAGMPMGIVTGISGKVTFPIFSKIQNDNERLINAYRNYVSLVMLLSCFGVILLAALAKPVILLLLSEKWSGAIIFLQIYAFAVIFDPIAQLNLNLLQIKGRADLFFKLEIIKKGIAIGVLFAAIPFGVLAICFSKIVYGQISLVINTYYTGKFFGLGYWSQMKDFTPYLLYSCISVIPAVLMAYFCPWNIVSIIVGAVASLGVYLLILIKIKDRTFMDHIYPYLQKALSKVNIKTA